MPEVTVDDTPLSDEKAVDAILDSLDVPELPFIGPRRDPARPPPFLKTELEKAEWAKPLPEWTRRLYDGYLFQKWHAKCDVWLQVSEERGTLLRVIISGLLDEKEAKLLRSEFSRYTVESPRKLTDIVNEIVATRDRRKYQEDFLYALKEVRNCFTWQDGVVVEDRRPRIAVIKVTKVTKEDFERRVNGVELSPDDVALLRAVYERLPRTFFDRNRDMEAGIKIKGEFCPMCGQRAAQTKKRKNYKRRGEVVRYLDEFNKGYPQELFDKWVSQRVKPGDFTSTTDLYSDYEVWVAEYGANRPEKAVAKSTILTSNKFSRVMKTTNYIFCKRNRANGYRARLKRREQRQ